VVIHILVFYLVLDGSKRSYTDNQVYYYRLVLFAFHAEKL